MCDVHRTYIGSVERGECNISIDNMERIAKGLGVTVVDMLRERVAPFAIYCVRCGASLTVVTLEQSIGSPPVECQRRDVMRTDTSNDVGHGNRR